jgi:RpiR family carbohydrate utilization transcriptional regulator
VNALERVNSIEFFGYVASGIVALDAPQKSPLFGVPCGAQTDANRQIMRVAMMGPGDVAVIISNTGRTHQLVEAARIAHESGATVIGLVGAEGSISALCDTILLVGTLDITDVYTPTASRRRARHDRQLSTAVACGAMQALGPAARNEASAKKFRSADVDDAGGS